jgi:hypothetical protein
VAERGKRGNGEKGKWGKRELRERVTGKGVRKPATNAASATCLLTTAPATCILPPASCHLLPAPDPLRRLVPLLDVGPEGMEMLVQTAAEKDVEVFVASGIGMIRATHCVNSLEVFAVALSVAA